MPPTPMRESKRYGPIHWPSRCFVSGVSSNRTAGVSRKPFARSCEASNRSTSSRSPSSWPQAAATYAGRASAASARAPSKISLRRDQLSEGSVTCPGFYSLLAAQASVNRYHEHLHRPGAARRRSANRNLAWPMDGADRTRLAGTGDDGVTFSSHRLGRHRDRETQNFTHQNVVTRQGDAEPQRFEQQGDRETQRTDDETQASGRGRRDAVLVALTSPTASVSRRLRVSLPESRPSCMRYDHPAVQGYWTS